MTTAEYRDTLAAVLREASPAAASKLAAIQRVATAGADGVLIDVFVDEDAEGTFSVWARFEGDDSFALDRLLGEERELFSVIWGEEGWEPEVPPRPSGWSRQALTDAIVGVVAAWVDPLIPVGGPDMWWEAAAPDSAAEPIAVGPQHG